MLAVNAMAVIKLRKVNTSEPSRLAHFDGLPDWQNLSSKIAEIFDIPQQDVGVAYVDNEGVPITLRNDQDLRHFYETIEFFEKMRLLVQDLRNHEAGAEIVSTWSEDSISDLGSDKEVNLFCWVLEESDQAFSVPIRKAKTVDNLQKEITTTKKNFFSGIDHDALNVWKLNPPIPSSEIAMKLERVQSPEDITGCSKLSPFDTIQEHFSSPPPKHLHILVSLPRRFTSGIARDRNRIVTPSSEVLELNALQPQIQEALGKIRPEIETFLQNPELPEWVPPSTNPSVSGFLRELRIPSYQDGSPSLLFHNLRSSSQGVKGIFDQRKNCFVCNTSGSGKTRLILEGLIKYWGFYFVAARDENNVGVNDLEDTLKTIGSYVGWTDDLRHFKGPAQDERDKSNIRISNRAIQKALAARVVVFKLFLQLAEARDGCIQADHRRLWLLFQLCNPLPGFESPHPFITMNECLNRASDRALTTLIKEFEEVHRQYFSGSKFIIALDEAQVAGQQYRFSFRSFRDPTKFRSILREIVKVFSDLVVQIFVSGTALSLEEVEDDLNSSVAKPRGRFATFVEFGMLDDPSKLEATLRQYIPPFMLDSDSGKCLQLRIREYLPGRYRFLIFFLELLLRNGMESPHSLLNEYLAQYLLCPPGDILSTTPFTSQEPPLCTELRIRTFEWGRLRQNSSDIRFIVAIIQSHLTKGATPTFGPLPHKHVEYGIARLRTDHQSEIIEPLAFLSIVRWLETQKDLCLETNLFFNLGNQHFRGYAFEEMVILFLLRTFCRPTPMKSVFTFHGTVPEWATKETYIIGRLAGEDVPVNVLEIPRYPSLGVVYYAKNIEDIIRWLKESPAPSVMVATNLFGPDVVIKCHGLLLMGQDKSFLTGNEKELDAATTVRALNSLNPMKWFVKETPQRRQMLIEAFEEFTILRFVASCPLPVNLDLQATSVQDALSDLGPVPLATISMDAFRAMFVLPGELRNVLQPMQHALSLKRKRDMMD